MQSIELLRSYRATTIPAGTHSDEAQLQADQGLLPTIQVKARNAARAAAAAHHLTGLHVLSVERIEVAA